MQFLIMWRYAANEKWLIKIEWVEECTCASLQYVDYIALIVWSVKRRLVCIIMESGALAFNGLCVMCLGIEEDGNIRRLYLH